MPKFIKIVALDGTEPFTIYINVAQIDLIVSMEDKTILHTSLKDKEGNRTSFTTKNSAEALYKRINNLT